MNIRTYRGTDLGEIIKIWNRTMPYNPVSRMIFLKNILLDHNFDDEGFFVAEENGEILGFIYGIVRRFPKDVGAPVTDDIGYINAIGLKYEKDILGGLGGALIKAVEDYFRRHGKQTAIISGYTPNFIYQGINTLYPDYLALFPQEGYAEATRNVSISIDLLKYVRPDYIDELKAQREQEGFLFTNLKDEYILELLKYVAPGVRHRVRRIIQETMDYERFNMVVYDGKVIGVNMFADPYSCEERFGPFSISADFRGKGLGKVLLHDCLTEMKNRGLQKAWAQSTPLESAASHIYAQAGFQSTNEYVKFKKDLQ